MVFFTCGNCGESIKKPSIAKHYMGRCRGPVNVTCVDCLKDFRGNEYEAHIKCVTEEERYSAKGFVAKASSNKGERKQQTWVEAVQEVLQSDKPLREDERTLLTLLSNHENLPRKKGKFINFLMNAHRAYARKQDLVERVWTLIEEAGKAATASPIENGNSDSLKNGVTNGNGEIEKTEPAEDEESKVNGKKEKKRKKEADDQEGEEREDGKESKQKKKRKCDTTEVDVSNKKIKSESSIIRQILDKEGGSISLYKLVQAIEKHCASEGDVENAAKAAKKLQKRTLISIEGEKIVLNCN